MKLPEQKLIYKRALNFKWKMKAWLLIMIALANACTKKQDIDSALESMLQHSVPIISTEQVYQLQNDPDLIVLDSREKQEFDLSHIPQATWVGFDTFDLSTLSALPKDKKIVVYCSIGVRSEKIAEKLVAAGFTDVQNLYGGIFAWANERKPLVKDNQEPTTHIHGYNQKWAELLEQHVPSPQKR